MISGFLKLGRLAVLAALFCACGGIRTAEAYEFLGFSFGDGSKVPAVIDPHRYTISFRVVGIEGKSPVARKLRDASALFTRSGRPTSGSAGLIRMAHRDYAQILSALFDQGRYGGSVSIRLAGREAAAISPVDRLPDPTDVVITINPGGIFTFGDLRILPRATRSLEGDDYVPTPEDEGFRAGEVAFAEVIRNAQDLSIEAWRQQGHALADVADTRVIADHATNRIDAAILLNPGPRLNFGRAVIRGSDNLDSKYLVYMADIPRGTEYDPDNVKAAKDRFARLGVFGSVVVREDADHVADGQIPIVFDLSDRKPRRIGIGASLSSIDGLGVEAFWMHRNLNRHAERLRFDAKVSGIDSVDAPDTYDYFLGASLTFPGTFTPDTDLFFRVDGERATFDTFRQTSVTGEIGVSRVFSPRLSGDFSAHVSRSQFEDDLGTRDFATFGFLGSVTLDRRDSRTDPATGYFLKAEIKPTYEFEFGNIGLRSTLEGRAYRSLSDDDSLVIAGRLKLGTFFGSTINQTAPDSLFFAGGGNSIRGYAFNGIGVTTAGGNVVGGRSLIEGSLEIRRRMSERFGAAAFTDFGVVTTDSIFAFDRDLLYGAGLGVRYYTLLGPIRFDLAFPLNRSKVDPNFGIYIGIGQAF
ncbi:MAG: autotransporter assembly complex family protein [Paracoccaceae bacterium]